MQTLRENETSEPIEHLAPPRLERWLPYLPSLYGFTVDATANFVSWIFRLSWKKIKVMGQRLTQTWPVDILGILGIVLIGLYSRRPIDRWRRFRSQSVMITAIFAGIVITQLYDSNNRSWMLVITSLMFALVFISFAQTANSRIKTLEGQR